MDYFDQSGLLLTLEEYKAALESAGFVDVVASDITEDNVALTEKDIERFDEVR